MNHDEKGYLWVDPYVTRQELIQLLVKGLDRPLKYQEVRILNWICDLDSQSRRVITELMKELVQRKERKNNRK
jgi:hypothetical protein